MITIIYSTHRDSNYNNNFKDQLLKSVGLENVQILEYINHNEYSLSYVYNKGISESVHDIIVCCHNDIKLEKNWGKKLLEDFHQNPEFGIIGKSGSCYFPKSGLYLEKKQQSMVGQVYYHPKGQKKWLRKYSPKLPFLVQVVTIEGLFISFDKTKIKHTFDESYGKFHFYDHGFSIPNYLDGVRIGVTSSFEITHESECKLKQEFFETKQKFIEKWGNKLPIDLKPSKIYIPDIKRVDIKNNKKIGIIIPTKGNVDLLLECIQSFFDHCDSRLFDIFIADTGSAIEEKYRIQKFISQKNNLKLVEYDYYNFAKINNETVKNHLNDQHEFILFCNNDVKILNDVISGFLEVLYKNKKTGTVGARLHYSDNTIQHNGIFMSILNERLQVGHLNLENYYNYYKGIVKVFGNTGALFMIKRKLFESIGYFNENYKSCFEDVELNISLLSSNLENYNNSNCVAYHYESKTRNRSSKEEDEDYLNNLIPYIQKKFDRIEKHIIMSD